MDEIDGPVTRSGRLACAATFEVLIEVEGFSGGLALSDDILARLAALIANRRLALADNSYTRQLLDAGPAKCARKLGEEAIETVLAGVSNDRDELRAEAADLLYHLLVLLEVRSVPLADVLSTLEARMSQSGLAEKAARKPS